MSNLNYWIALVFFTFSPIVFSSNIDEARELYEKSITSYDDALLTYYHSKLAKEYPDNDYGLFGKASILSENDRNEEAATIYASLIAKNTKVATIYINYLAIVQDNLLLEEVTKLKRKAMEVAVETNDPLTVSFIMRYYGQLIRDDPSSEHSQSLLAELKSQSGNEFSIAYWSILSAIAEVEGDFDKAIECMENAARSGFSFGSVWRHWRLIELQQRLTQGKNGHLILNNLLRLRILIDGKELNDPIVDKLTERLYLLAVSLAMDEYKDYSLAWEILSRVMHDTETINAMELFVKLSYDKDPEVVHSYLERWVAQYPDFDKVHIYYGLHLDEKHNDVSRASKEYNLGFQLSPSESRRKLNLGIIHHFNIANGLFEQGEKVYPKNDYYLTMRGELALLAHNDELALDLLTEAERKFKHLNRELEWFIDNIKAKRADTERLQKENPFIKNWEEKFQGGLKLAVEFASDSSQIPVSDYPSLNTAADLLNAENAKNYIFRIEGHTDSTGGDIINIPLSKARAESVKNYLVERQGVDAGRLQTKGFGALHPVAPNTTEIGRHTNRRVDILPFGNLKKPELVSKGYLDTSSAVFSQDGKYVAAGEFPISLWDMRSGIKLRELYIGGDMRRFSPNGRYLAAASSATDTRGTKVTAIYITDTKTGAFKTIIPFFRAEGSINLDWSPDSRRLAYVSDSGELSVYSLESDKVENARRISDIKITGSIKWGKNHDYLFLHQQRKSELYVFDANNLELIKTIEGVAKTVGIGESDDGKVIVVADDQLGLIWFDSENFTNLGWLYLESTVGRNILAIPGTTRFVMDDVIRNEQIQIFDYSTGKIVSSKNIEGGVRIGAAPDGRHIYLASDHKVSVLDENLEKVSGFGSVSDRARGELSWSEDKSLVFFQDEASLNVWSVKESRLVHRVAVESSIWKQRKDNPNEWWAVAKSGEILKFSSVDFSLKRFPGIDFEAGTIEISENTLVISEKQKDLNKVNDTLSKIFSFSMIEERKIFATEVDVVTAAQRHPGGIYYAAVESIAINEKLGLIAYSTSWNENRRANIYSRHIQFLDMTTGKKGHQNILSNYPIESLAFDGAEESRIKVWDHNSSFLVDLNTGLNSEPALKTWRELNLDGGGKIEYGAFFLAVDGKRKTIKERIFSVAADKSRNLILVHTESNYLLYFDFNTLEQKLKVQIDKEGEWVAADSRGYFTSSLNGAKNVFWSLGDNFLSFEDLKDKFENDRAVRESIASLFGGAAISEPDPILVPEYMEAPFEVSLEGSQTLSTKAESYKMVFKIKKDSKKIEDPTVHYLVNGRKSRGFDKDPFADLDESLTYVRTIPLGVGENIIEAIINYQGVTVSKLEVVVTREEVRTTSIEKNTLWFFGVGVSEYKNSLQNLDYADRDAIELEKSFKALQGKLFNKVNTKILTNSEATAREVKIALFEFLADAKPEDNVVIFIAGHGVQDQSQALYFMTHDGDMRRPYTGMSIEDFKIFLDQRPINQRTLFLMDICHAGSIGDDQSGRMSAEDAIKKLSAGTATTVFSSSKGAQQSLEDESFGGGHGAFTYAILKAMKGAADKQIGNDNGFVSLLELLTYTLREVPRITNKAQEPVIPRMANFSDYNISVAE